MVGNDIKVVFMLNSRKKRLYCFMPYRHYLTAFLANQVMMWTICQ